MSYEEYYDFGSPEDEGICEDDPLTYFLFGNVDEAGCLESDFFDEETKSQLQNISSYLRGTDVFPKSTVNIAPADGSNMPWNQQSSEGVNSEDFFNIDEVIAEEESDDILVLNQEFARDLCQNEDINSLENQITPLAAMLPEEFRDADARVYFPEFKKGKVLRFSRLFRHGRPGSYPQIWRNPRSRRRLSTQASVVADTTKLSEEKYGFHLNLGGTPPPEMCETDDELRILQPEQARGQKLTESDESSLNESRIPAWRFGPAQYWYDQMGVSETGEGFDYGFKLKKKVESEVEKAEVSVFSPETFLPVNFVQWEDNIIWDGDTVREEVMEQLSSGKQPLCGWIPTQQTRTYESFMATLKNGGFISNPCNSTVQQKSFQNSGDFSREPAPNHSIFPMENQELKYGNWEDDIIWDSENMDFIPSPKILTLDIYEDPKLFGVPEDKERDEGFGDKGGPSQDGSLAGNCSSPSKAYDRKEHQFTKKSQLILGQVQRRKREEEEELESSMAQMSEKDQFNLSNDEYYLPKGSSRQLNSFASSMIQHSIPAQNLQRPFFPTHLSPKFLRCFHRPSLKRYYRGYLNRFQLISSLQQYIVEKEKHREDQRRALGGGEIFFMREPEDLSGKDGELIFCEFSEEHPSIMQQPGMASKIKNYYKRKPGKESEPSCDYGETAFSHSSPFLGNLGPGEALQALENNLYRAPIYLHKFPDTDFLLIRTNQGFFIRPVKTLFCVGQQYPLYDVPSPNSKRATHFVRDFLLAFIYRLFMSSNTDPRRLRMEDIRKAFPHYAESSVRKRLKQCADFKRLGPGTEQNFWVLRSDFRLPSKEEVQAMVTAEMACAHYSMQIAEQRLKDAGYGEKFFMASEEDDDNEQVTMEDEIKCAPWNTTRAYISAAKGKCLLDQTGIADPTGCGEGFSFVRVSAKPQKEDIPTQPKRLVTGTDADLRKLPLKDAKQMLRDFGVKEEEIKSLSRWEIIDVIRTLSTQQAKSKSDFTGIAKFARGNIRFNLAEMQERYKQECQRIFELQNRTLGSEEVLSTDEEESEDSDIEEMGKNIESMLSGAKKTSARAVFDAEEKERQELQRLMLGKSTSGDDGTKKSQEEKTLKKKLSTVDQDEAESGRKLKIYRTFQTEDGSRYQSVEVVTRPYLIDAYIKIRKTRDEAFIKAFAQMDEQYKEERRREKRRLQDQLRRIRRNELKAKQGFPLGRPVSKTKKQLGPRKPPPPPKPSLLKMKCSACGGTGHMRTNKNCPMYGQARARLPPQQVAPTDEQLDKDFVVPEGRLISVEDTKIKLNKALFIEAERVKRKALQLKIPKHIIRNNSQNAPQTIPSLKISREKLTLLSPVARKRLKKRKYGAQHAEYLTEGPKQSVQRRRADPRVTLGVLLEEVINEARELPSATNFLIPVNPKLVSDYYGIVKDPMDLQKIRMKVKKNSYETRAAFLDDFQKILQNSRLYNGDKSDITKNAIQLMEFVTRRVAEKEQKLMKLEKAINPLLDDNDLVGFNFLLENIVQKCKNLPKSFSFHQPVDAKKVKTYYDKVKNPMDLGSMEQKCKKHQYLTVDTFFKDLEQIHQNSVIFNTDTSLFTVKAREILEFGKQLVAEEKTFQDLKTYEANIQKALESVETESVLTGPSSAADVSERPSIEDIVGDEDTVPYTCLEEVASSRLEQGSNDTLSAQGEESDGRRIDFKNFEDKVVVESAVDEQMFEEEEGEEDRRVQMEFFQGPLLGLEEMNFYQKSEALLNASSIARTGQLNTDLAMSDSDEEGEDTVFAHSKRPTVDDLDFDTL